MASVAYNLSKPHFSGALALYLVIALIYHLGHLGSVLMKMIGSKAFCTVVLLILTWISPPSVALEALGVDNCPNKCDKVFDRLQ